MNPRTTPSTNARSDAQWAQCIRPELDRARLGLLVLGTIALALVFAKLPIASNATPLVSTQLIKAVDAGIVGTLVGKHYEIDVISTDEGPKYTVRTTEGAVLGMNLRREELLTMYPDAPINRLDAEKTSDAPVTTLMLADDFAMTSF